ncbi:uncharacterized protein PFL1_06722 [Pseudozyma flocculosa PF-1]|uniref:Alpha-galactosidase n=2 Tax=Pseudozyma flocculosa TaxID=84751 RepID=A0A5C3F4L0_9BASI|nr:uncharacterized protein PFL1_06722 [Pseudozyma flocculosa PF-1]EPQ25728.1 hypothetical protein PFL1_06722 [Pseudozyma flocculosa PF-1]SPO38896.1 probable alpha-galactosidase [Pseudozyma flocculosa]
MVRLLHPFTSLLPLASALALALALGPTTAWAYNNGLARTPQRGWNTWNSYGCSISEDVILDAAQAIVDEGLDRLGYEYVIIDDCWQGARRDNDTGIIPADAVRFPNGLRHVVERIHALGLKAGIYSSAGTMTCGRRIGSLDHETTDANAWAADGFDYLKYDNCFNQGRSGTPDLSHARYDAMSKALNQTGRPILYSMCNWGEDAPWLFATEIANSWRMSGDIYPSFDRDDDRCPCTDITQCKLHGYHCSIAKILEFAAPLGQKAYPGAWNDLDMLEVGNTGLSLDESLVHFSMWAMLKSPLILGNDVTAMTNQTRAIIANTHVLALSDDPTGSPAIRLWKKPVSSSSSSSSSSGGNVQLWKMPLDNGTYAVAAVNLSPEAHTLSIDFDDVFYDEHLENDDAAQRSWDAFDLWSGVDFHTFDPTPAPYDRIRLDASPFSRSIPNITVPRHGIRLLKLAQAGTRGMGMSKDEMQRRDLERKANVRMGRAREWMAGRQERRLDARGL